MDVYKLSDLYTCHYDLKKISLEMIKKYVKYFCCKFKVL